jgi:hypothetical protein
MLHEPGQKSLTVRSADDSVRNRPFSATVRYTNAVEQKITVGRVLDSVRNPTFFPADGALRERR